MSKLEIITHLVDLSETVKNSKEYGFLADEIKDVISDILELEVSI